MRCIIAHFAFDLTKSDVQASMKGIKPEAATGEYVVIGRHRYPVKQVGEVVTRQDRRDFSAAEMTRALVSLGYTCGSTPTHLPAAAPSPLLEAQFLLGVPTST
ncbi:SCO5918 family protein [Streptomyces sp. NPDC051976]|uniref:SCO5918 family protein n=1 Tax=Streptomyces sp. NPDC051976 TaxID=3154947 RepID=UPI0034365EDD